MRFLAIAGLVMLVGCGADPQGKVVDLKTAAQPSSRTINGEHFTFDLPDGWQRFDLTQKNAEKAIESLSVGKDPEKAREMLRAAISSGLVKFMAFKAEYEGDFSPNVNVVVTPTVSKDLRTEFDGLKKAMQSIGTVKSSRLDEAGGVIEMQCQLQGSAAQPYQTYQLIRLKDQNSVTLTVSFLENQRSALKETVNLVKQTFTVK
ncbi:MAG: hypothetical protein HONBIEJF_01639 [Fimbriimonadaceae bacterium]|nr:hypothetical protein [Fimbriimonadaceae bacterium]